MNVQYTCSFKTLVPLTGGAFASFYGSSNDVVPVEEDMLVRTVVPPPPVMGRPRTRHQTGMSAMSMTTVTRGVHGGYGKSRSSDRHIL